MDTNVKFADLISFIREEAGEFNLEINENTLIEDDLGVTGVEAEELIFNFSSKYGVDISKFDPSQYFNPEPSLFVRYKQIKPLTIGNLFQAIMDKKLQ